MTGQKAEYKYHRVLSGGWVIYINSPSSTMQKGAERTYESVDGWGGTI